MKFIRDLLSVNSTLSMMRLCSFICVIAAIILAFYEKPGYEYFLLCVFGGKVAHKFAEIKQPNADKQKDSSDLPQ